MIATTSHIASITLDEAGIARRTDQIDHERSVAMNDLIEWNHFAIKGSEGPYHVTLSSAGNSITFSVVSETLTTPMLMSIPLAPFRGILRDYLLICESYFEAMKVGNIAKIEAIDMSRRGFHNEGADLLADLLGDKVQMDSETARRLFTLVHVLHLK